MPGIGRFASADTLVPDPQNPQQFNRYTYSLNSPLVFTDPTGHRECGLEKLNCNQPELHQPSSSPQSLPPIFPPVPSSVPPSQVPNYDHTIATLTWLQDVTSSDSTWWGKELTANELIAFLIAQENSVGYPYINDIMTAKYNLHCGAGSWSASCIQGFWTYFSAMINMYNSLDLQNAILTLPQRYDPTNYLSQACDVTGRPEFGTAYADWGWGNLNRNRNAMAFNALQMADLDALTTYYELKADTLFFVITPDQKTAICSVKEVDCSLGLIKTP